MSHLHISRLAVIMIAGLSLSAGCGGAQNATAPTAVAPQRVTGSAQARKSWMLPGASTGDLIYVSGKGNSYVLSFPEGKLVGTIAGAGAAAACSDGSGNVFLPVNKTVLEYGHGATTPTKTLDLPDYGYGCSIDPTTGNLAVTLNPLSNDVAIFKGAQGTATVYNTGIGDYYCGYDNNGNLFVDGYTNQLFALTELPSGSSSFINVSVNPYIAYGAGQVQWDGQYITVESGTRSYDLGIYRLSISGSTATVVSVTNFKGVRHTAHLSWIFGGKIIVPYAKGHGLVPNVGLWNYPDGGKPTHLVKNPAGKDAEFTGVTVSVASAK